MKQQLSLFIAAAALLMSFASCSKSESEPTVIKERPKASIDAFPDCSSLLGITRQKVLSDYGNPITTNSNEYGTYLSYDVTKMENVDVLTFIISPETDCVWGITQTLAAEVFAVDSIRAYLGAKYSEYPPYHQTYHSSQTDRDVTEYTYRYGNNENVEESTVYIEYNETGIVSYFNPQEEPLDPTLPESFVRYTPRDVVATLLGEDLMVIVSQYEGSFTEYAGKYSITIQESEWLSGFSFTANELGIIDNIVLLYADLLTDADIVDYYTAAGYQCDATGDTDSDGHAIYTFIGHADKVLITYSGGKGVAVRRY